MSGRATSIGVAVLAVLVAACPQNGGRPRPVDGSGPAEAGAPPAAEACPHALPAPHLLPGTRPEHRQPGFWIARATRPDEVLLDRAAIEALNRRARALSRDSSRLGARVDLLADGLEAEPVLAEMAEALGRHRQGARDGTRVFLSGERPPETCFDAVDAVQRSAEAGGALHVAARLTALRCHPSDEGLYEMAGDVDFDLFQCATVHAGELYRAVTRHPEGWALVRTAYAWGWVRDDDLGPEVGAEVARQLLAAEPFVVVRRDRVPLWRGPDRLEQVASVDLGLRLPLLGRDPSGLLEVLGPAGDRGLAPVFAEADDFEAGYLPLTRRNLIRAAFERLDDVFGWGGAGGDRDCSRFLMDLFALFGLELPRNSSWQSLAGTTSVDVSSLDLEARRAELDRVLERGIGLLYMPGHIMLLIGRDGGEHFVIHQFSGYRVGCAPGHDVKMSVDRVAVTDLRLGESSERRSFIERITQIVVLGGGAAEGPAAAPPAR